MTTAVLDTNALASGFVRRRPEAAPVQILDAWRSGVFMLVVSEYLLLELERTLARPYFAARLSQQQVASNLTLLRSEAVLIPLTVNVHGAASHPEDDPILATAVSGRADYLVTGDIQLQRLGTYEGVAIVSPRGFLAVVQAAGPHPRH